MFQYKHPDDYTTTLKSSKSNSGKGFKSLLQRHSEEMHTVAGEECDYAKVGHKSGIVGGTGNYFI